MATILKLILDRRRLQKNGVYPICLHLNFRGRQSYINLGRKVDPRYWSQEFGRVTKGAPCPSSSPAIWNAFLKDKFDNAMQVIEAQSERGKLELLTHAELRELIQKGASAHQSFSSYLDSLIAEFDRNGNQGQKKIYEGAKTFLKKYGDKTSGDYLFEDVNYRLLTLMEGRWKPRVEGSLNGLGLNLRTIRAVWNRAIKEDVVKADKYPFNKYKIKKSRTHKVAISLDDLQRIAQLNLPVNTTAWHGRNYFFFSFHCRGMNFADIADLRNSSIAGGRINYMRKKTKRKTGSLISIVVTPEIQAILDIYKRESPAPSDFVFPIINPQSIRTAHRQEMLCLGSVNHALKRWAKQCNLPHSLSFNTARHSWATIAKNLGLPIAIISQGLDHGDIQTTTNYLDEFDNSQMDAASRIVSDSLRIQSEGSC